MKIIYDYQVFTGQRHGGISRYFFEIITRLSMQPDYQVIPFLGYHINRYDFDGYKADYYDYFSRNRPEWPHTGRIFSIVNSLMFRRFLAKHHPSIYHATYYGAQPTRKGTANIVTVFDMIHEKFPEHFSPNDQTRSIKKTAVHNADGIICISKVTKDDLLSFYPALSSKRIEVVHLASSLQPGSIEHVPELLGSAPFILYVGGRTGYKNFNLLLEAFQQDPLLRAEFRLLCFGGNKFNSAEKACLAKMGLTDSVHWVDGDDILLTAVYQRATAFVYPSLYEGFGIPPLEAMSCGCPVLASQAGSIPEVVGDAALLFDPFFVEDLKDKLHSVVTDSGLRSHLRAEGYECVNRYSWQKCADETGGFYKHFS